MKRKTLGTFGCIALILCACGSNPAGKGDAATPDSGTPSGSDTVDGTVLDTSGNPVAHVPVMLLGSLGNSEQVAVTDGSGAFHFSGVAASYDLATVTSDKTSATVIKSLTRRSPTLRVYPNNDSRAPSRSTHSAKVQGAVSGGQTPYSSDNFPGVSFYSPSRVSSSFKADSSLATYSGQVSWQGDTSTTGSVMALQSIRDPMTGLTKSYGGFGRRDNVLLTDGATLSAQDVHLDAVTTSTLGFNTTMPSSVSLYSASVTLEFDDHTRLYGVGQSQPATSFALPVPQIPHSTFQVSVTAGETGKAFSSDVASYSLRRGLSAPSTTSLELLGLPSPEQPVDGMTGVTLTTDFSWDPVAAGTTGTYGFTLETASDNPAPYSLTVITSDPHTSLTNLGAIGLPLPAGTLLTWSVEFDDIAATVDELLRPDPPDSINLQQYHISYGPSRAVVTANAP